MRIRVTRPGFRTPHPTFRIYYLTVKSTKGQVKFMGKDCVKTMDIYILRMYESMPIYQYIS